MYAIKGFTKNKEAIWELMEETDLPEWALYVGLYIMIINFIFGWVYFIYIRKENYEE